MAHARFTPIGGASAIAEPMAKGTTVRSTLDFLEQTLGSDGLLRVLDRLAPEQRAALGEIRPTGELPFAFVRTLWHACDAELASTAPDWIERSGALSIASVGLKLYGGILRKPTPAEFLTEGISLFRLYYHPGDMEVVEQGTNRSVLRLVGFHHEEPLFCRRQTGGLRQALEAAGGVRPQVVHVRCALEGDAFCEWELNWSSP